MPDDLAPPPLEREPEYLRLRIEDQLHAEQARRFRPQRVIIPLVAAAAAVAAIIVAVSPGGNQVVQQAGMPTPAATSTPTAASPTTVNSASPTTTTRRATPTTEAPRDPQPLTKQRIESDTKRCLRGWEKNGVIERKGKMAAIYAQAQVPLPYRDVKPTRVLILQDDAATILCRNGLREAAMDRGQNDAYQPDADAAAKADMLSESSSRICEPASAAMVGTQLLLHLADDRVATVRVTVSDEDGAILTSDSPPVGDVFYTDIELTGSAARTVSSMKTEVLDKNGRRLPIQLYSPGKSLTKKALTYPLDHC